MTVDTRVLFVPPRPGAPPLSGSLPLALRGTGSGGSANVYRCRLCVLSQITVFTDPTPRPPPPETLLLPMSLSSQIRLAAVSVCGA